MKPSISEKRLVHLALACLAMLFLLPVCLRADDPADGGAASADADNMIRISSDRLVTDTLAKSAEFIGNVKVVRGDMAIVCDRLKILYTDDAAPEKDAKPGTESIRSIVAEGNVKIDFREQQATTQRAEWSPGDQTIVLSGKGSRIVSGKNAISGSKITLHQSDNRIKVEGGDDERVEASIFSDQKGLPFDQ